MLVKAKRKGWNERLTPQQEFDYIPLGADESDNPSVTVDLKGPLVIVRGQITVHLVNGQEADPNTIQEVSH